LFFVENYFQFQSFRSQTLRIDIIDFAPKLFVLILQHNKIIFSPTGFSSITAVFAGFVHCYQAKVARWCWMDRMLYETWKPREMCVGKNAELDLFAAGLFFNNELAVNSHDSDS